MTKIIFFDIDGTLIDMEKKRCSEKTLETLRRLQQKGIRICIATGRSPIVVPKFEGVEFDAFLTYNGSYCYDKHQTILSNSLSKEDVFTLIHNAAALGRPLSLATKDRLASNGKDDDLVAYYAFGGLEVQVADDFDQVAEGEVYQVLMSGREEEYPKMLAGTHNAKIAAWWDRAVDIIPTAGGKGIGIEKMLEYYGLDKSEAMAFGDGNNDIPMLEAVGTGVAMGNGSDRVKAAAKDVCGTAAEDGIYHYCLTHGLI